MATVLLNALADQDGALRDITRIEFEVLDGKRCRCILWDGPERAFSAITDPPEYPGMLKMVGIVLDAMAGIRCSDEADDEA